MGVAPSQSDLSVSGEVCPLSFQLGMWRYVKREPVVSDDGHSFTFATFGGIPKNGGRVAFVVP